MNHQSSRTTNDVHKRCRRLGQGAGETIRRAASCELSQVKSEKDTIVTYNENFSDNGRDSGIHAEMQNAFFCEGRRTVSACPTGTWPHGASAKTLRQLAQKRTDSNPVLQRHKAISLPELAQRLVCSNFKTRGQRAAVNSPHGDATPSWSGAHDQCRVMLSRLLDPTLPATRKKRV